MDGLDLDLAGVDLGPTIVTCTIEGIVDADDLLELSSPVQEPAMLGDSGERSTFVPAAPQAEPEDPTDLKRVREKHHSVARMIAQGMSQSLVANLAGLTDSYLSILLNSPAMRELVEMYRIQSGSVAQVIGEKLRTVGMKAIEKLDGKLEGDDLNAQELLGLAKLGLDRGGFGPSSTTHSTHIEHVVDHAAIAALQKQALEGSREYSVPVEAVRAALPAPAVESEE